MSSVRRLTALPMRDWALLAEAASRLALARLAIHLRPFQRALTSSSVNLGPADASCEPEKAAWAVRAAARRMPFRALCFEQGLALQAMLRRRGHNALLHYGVHDDAADGLTAHVWVTDQGRIIIGEEGHERFACLHTTP